MKYQEGTTPGYYPLSTREGAPRPQHVCVYSAMPLAHKVLDGPCILTSVFTDPGSDNASEVILYDGSDPNDLTNARRICRVTSNGAPAGWANIVTPIQAGLIVVRNETDVDVTVWWQPEG